MTIGEFMKILKQFPKNMEIKAVCPSSMGVCELNVCDIKLDIDDDGEACVYIDNGYYD